MIQDFGEGDEAEADAEAEEAAHVGDVVGEGDGHVALDLLNVRITNCDRNSKKEKVTQHILQRNKKLLLVSMYRTGGWPNFFFTGQI